MSSTAERIPKDVHGAERVARMFADGIATRGIGIVSGVYWKEGCDKQVLLTMNATSGQRVSGSGTPQEVDYNELLKLRAEIAGILKEGSREVGILYSVGMVSIPDNGEERIATLVEGYQRVEE